MWAHLDLIYEAFWTLNLDRPVAWGLGPISLLSILSYLELIGIEASEREERIYWFRLIRALDFEYLSYHADKDKKKPKKK